VWQWCGGGPACARQQVGGLFIGGVPSCRSKREEGKGTRPRSGRAGLAAGGRHIRPGVGRVRARHAAGAASRPLVRHAASGLAAGGRGGARRHSMSCTCGCTRPGSAARRRGAAPPNLT
jgi:hypothetical protein